VRSREPPIDMTSVGGDGSTMLLGKIATKCGTRRPAPRGSWSAWHAIISCSFKKFDRTTE
jgi:hypothetical protein